MKIITVNLSEVVIEELRKIVIDDKKYPSRSEAVRVAVKNFLFDILIEKMPELEKMVEKGGQFPWLYGLANSGTIDMRTIRFQ